MNVVKAAVKLIVTRTSLETIIFPDRTCCRVQALCQQSVWHHIHQQIKLIPFWRIVCNKFVNYMKVYSICEMPPFKVSVQKIGYKVPHHFFFVIRFLSTKFKRPCHICHQSITSSSCTFECQLSNVEWSSTRTGCIGWFLRFFATASAAK